MALVKQETIAGFSGLPALRQIGLMIGLAASVAVGVAVVLWSQSPSFSLLYGKLSDRDASQVMEALDKAGIPYKLDESSGALLVSGPDVHRARLQLASDGLPKGTGSGFELLDEDQGFGTSQFIENARYQRALEGEISRTIATLRNVKSARVHLALPKRSVFIRKQAQPTASVTVELYGGRSLEEGQVGSIVHLVASSVPHLSADQVTVVDQNGLLLTSSDHSQPMGLTTGQFNYNRQLEQTFVKRIEDLLSPLVGRSGVRAQVAAELDFTVTEKTQETYNPDLPALRSEQSSEDRNTGGLAAIGVPGTLSNQPPGGAVAAPVPPAGAGGAPEDVSQPSNSSRSTIRNYELDKTISHTRLASGSVRRLSIAVVLDNKQATGEKGKPVREPWSDQELAKFTTLVKEAVGFNAQRGDSVQVVNAAFQLQPEMEPLPDLPLWEQPWLWNVLKQVAGAFGVLLLIFGVIRPVMRSLAEKGAVLPSAAQMALAGGTGFAEDQVTLSGSGAQVSLPSPQQQSYEQQIAAAKGLVQNDPKRVAQVMKNWVSDNG
jgi:flagellar M-ring protein FliF